MNDKIQPAHLRRLAVIYVRQSTLHQLFANPESTRRQYALRDRAQELGWPVDAVQVIDEDLGKSGADALHRTGFRRLCNDVARGVIGAIFVLELSRLSRSSTDWHRLLDLCGVADVLLIDEQGIYHPADANDRMVLGIKGTMSEAERDWIQLRLRGARLSKARRGDYRLTPPVGYVWDRATSRLRLDPDAQVQAAVRLVFERFGIEHSASGVARYLVSHGLGLPARSPDGATVQWASPRPSRIVTMLHNPTYAGAYVFGRRTPRAELVDGAIVRRSVRVPIEAWQIVHRDHHPAYLDWEQFMTNQHVLTDNRANHSAQERHGAPRSGGALLQGLVLCGHCGHRMRVAYDGHDGRASYRCTSTIVSGYASRTCGSVRAAAIDDAVGERFLGALTSDALTVALAVSEEALAQSATLDRQWTLRVQQARYEAQLAERRYKAVDPDHRTVAQTLEHEWEVALDTVTRIEREQDEMRARGQLELTAAQRAQIERLAHDVPGVWASASTTMEQRKAMVRTLIREVCLTAHERGKGGTQVRILWQTGAVTDFAVARQFHGRVTSSAATTRIREMVTHALPAGEIAVALNRARLPTAMGLRWTSVRVHVWCQTHQLRWPRRMPSSRPQPLRRANGLYSTRGVARRLRVTPGTVHSWVRRGWLRIADGGTIGHPRWYRLDDETIARLRSLRTEHKEPQRHAA